MDFTLSEEQKAIKTIAKKFAQTEFTKEIVHKCDREEKFPKELWLKACEVGLVGVFIPEAYGGPGLGYLEDCLINEEFWRVDPGVGKACQAVVFGSEMLILYGSEEQKKRWLPPLVKGEAISGTAITEPDAGTDVTSIRTKAELDGDQYIINGNKMFITNGTVANYIAVLCRTNPEAESRHGQFSFIMVETDREGFEARKLRDKLGIRASDTGDLYFTDVRVPKENLIGTEAEGFKQFMFFLNHTRLHICAEAVGLAQGALDQAIDFAKTRQSFGKPLSSFQVTGFKIAEMATLIEASRSLYQKAAWFVDQGRVEPHLVSMAKWFAGETAMKVAEESLQIHGGYGFIGEYDIERFFRAAKVVEIYEGTKEAQKMVIAKRMLK
jgi:alkylation response protein AidB-like acyl-CoA dehydrogenase